jgi:hypothetical protein
MCLLSLISDRSRGAAEFRPQGSSRIETLGQSLDFNTCRSLGKPLI